MAEDLHSNKAENRSLRQGKSSSWATKITGPMSESEVAMLFDVKERPLGKLVAAKTA